MSLDIDGFAVFAAIAAHRGLFDDLAAEVDKTARTIVVKHLKRKQLDLSGLRALRSALGEETLALVLDALSAAEIASLLTKCDKHNAEMKAAGDGARRARLNSLLAGEAEPAPASKAKGGKKAKAAAPKPAPAPTAGLSYASAGRVRKPTR